MSSQLKKSLIGAVALILLGTVALFGGAESLAVLIPLALLVYSSVQHYSRGNRSV
jgi:predicted exporter